MTEPQTATERPRRADFDGDAFDVGDDDPPARCPHCGRPFASEKRRTLHLGNAHPETLTDDEIERFRTAHDEEEADLRRFRLLALGGLVLIYFGLLLIYATLAL